MIIDVHTHTPRHRTPPPASEQKLDALWRPDQKASTAHTWEDSVAAMEVVDRAIVFNIASDPRGDVPDDGQLIYATPGVNDDTAAFVRAYPEKFIGFLTVHPHDPKVLEEIERATGDLGLRGIKLGPNYQNFDPLGEEAFRVFKRAEELGCRCCSIRGRHRCSSPISTMPTRGTSTGSRWRFRSLRMILAHIGHPWQIDCIVVIRKHPHVYADISANFYRPWSYYNAFR